MDLGHWTIKESLYTTENPFGFIYMITNNVNGRQYIGKKQCVSRVKRKPLKGKTRNRIDHKESDWKTYTGSSKELNEDIAKHGKENFTFEILEWGGSKWELGYKEIKKQLEYDVLLNEQFYNGIINVRIGKPPKNFLK
jgi:hypothetical protein